MSRSGESSRRREAARAKAAERAIQAKRKRQFTWIAGLALAGLVVLGLGGWAIFNGNGAEEPEQTATGESVSQEEATLAFFQCLRDHGLDVEDPDTSSGGIVGPGGGPAGLDIGDPEVLATIETCRDETGGGPMQGGNFGDNLAETDSLFNFVRCLQEHGIDMPDPDADGTLHMPEGLDPQSPELEAAREACVEHLDGGGVRVQGPGDGPRGAVGGR